MKKVIALILVAVLSVGMLAACGTSTDNSSSSASSAATTDSAKGTDTATGGQLIGVAMPTQSLQRWNQDGANMKKELEGKGYKVDLQYANNDVNTQIQQIET